MKKEIEVHDKAFIVVYERFSDNNASEKNCLVFSNINDAICEYYNLYKLPNIKSALIVHGVVTEVSDKENKIKKIENTANNIRDVTTELKKILDTLDDEMYSNEKDQLVLEHMALQYITNFIYDIVNRMIAKNEKQNL